MRIRPLRWIARGIAQGIAQRSLRTRIGAGLALLVFLVAGLLGGLVGQTSEIEAQARIGQSLAVDAQRLAERLNTEMATRARELSLLAGIDALRELPATAAASPGLGVTPALTPALSRTQALLDELKRSFPPYTWIAVASPAGRVLAATDPTSLGQDISTRRASRDGLRGRSPSDLRGPEQRLADLKGADPKGADLRGADLRGAELQGPELSGRDAHVTDSRVMDLVQPIRGRDGGVVGLLAAQLAWSWIGDLERSVITADSDGSTRREAYLVSSQDSILLGPPESLGLTLPLPAAARARAGFYGWSVEAWPAIPGGGAADDFLTGVAFAAGEGPAPGPGSQPMRWSVLVREAQGVAFAPAARLRREIWLSGLGIAIGFAAFGWLLAGMITAPLARIGAAAERLRQGDDVEIPRFTGPPELASLSAALRALVATLTRKQQALDEMEEFALRDPLTGLLNRHGLRVHLQTALTKAQMQRTSLMIFVGDLDGFKSVNDTLGHAIGDLLLCQVASRLAQSVRSDDLVARIGGDEFVLALMAPGGVDDATAVLVAQRAQTAISQPYQIAGHSVAVGCSLGGACWPQHVTGGAAFLSPIAEVDQVIQLADAALYDVKRSGKGRVELHHAVVGPVNWPALEPDRRRRVDTPTIG